VRVPLALAAAVVLAAGGCGGSSGDSGADELLQRAKTVLDDTSGVHVELTSKNLPDGGTALERAEGDVARPPAFKGTLRVRLSAITGDVDVVSVDGNVYLKLPFTSHFEKTDPKRFGLSDPALLLAAKGGVSDLLVADEDAEVDKDVRLDGELLRRVTARLPGDLVDDVLASQDPSAAVDATFDIDPDSGELRRAVLVGPFFAKDVRTTFTLVLDKYGQRVDIRAP
jgi:lipoprotein LprG